MSGRKTNILIVGAFLLTLILIILLVHFITGNTCLA